MSDEKEKESAEAAKPARESVDDEIIVQLGKSIWHQPLRFLGSLVLTIVPLVALFFVEKAFAKYALAGLSGLGLVSLLGYIFVTKVCSTYTITKERCTSEQGFISRKISEVQSRHIRNINVHQGFLQRILGIGNVEISTAGGADIEVIFYSVPDPLGVRRLIDDFRPSEID